MKFPASSDNRVGNPLRRIARVLGVLCGGFQLLMFLGYVLQGRGPSPGSLEPIAALSLVLMGAYSLAMFLALKWERASVLTGVVTLVAFNIILFLDLLPGNVSGGFSARGVLNPVFLALWLPLVFYGLAWRSEARRSG